MARNRRTSTFQFCENGAKAVTWEATRKRVTPEFFAQHTVSSLLKRSDFELEGEGRITHPMAYDPATDSYRAVEWSEAFQRIGAALRALPDPNMAEFYTSGRASNEAAYLYQLFARELRHQQPARLLEHVPRVDVGGPAEVDRHRQGLR